MSTLSDTQKTILQAAAQRHDGAIYPLPDHIKGGAALKVIRVLADKGLIHETHPNDWRISDDGYRAIGQEPPAAQDPLDTLIKQIANDYQGMDSLRAAYNAGLEAGRTETRKQRKTGPCKNTKQALIIEMMKHPEGATINQLAEASGWNKNTVRGVISGALKKRLGLNVTSERTVNARPNAKGGFSTYFIRDEETTSEEISEEATA
ncbi:MAG: DUF3489 domain-containing protein [Magnetococcales bacterium]|nr:DUF3489 domain-containing protein [Magnetococcales bacterium]